MITTETHYMLIRDLLSLLFDKEQENIDKQERALIDQHIAQGGSQDGFRYMGRIYSHLTGRLRSMGQYDQLKPDLVPKISDLDTEREILKRDRERISQALALVLRGCVNWQDIRDALPNGLHEFMEPCRNMERTRPEAWTLKDDPRAHRQYMKLRDKIDYYLATRLLY